MKKQLSCVLACALAFGGAAVYAGVSERIPAAQADLPAPQQAAAEIGESTSAESFVSTPDVNGDYLSPLVTMRADPYLYKHEGTYYFTGSYPEYDRIELTCADSVNGIAAAVPKTVWTKPDYAAHVWAPEIHYIMGQWVIY